MCFRVFASGSLLWLKIRVWRNTTSVTSGHRISLSVPWAYPISIICHIPLWPWFTVGYPDESSHIEHCSLSAINVDTLHNTQLDQWYSGQSICQQLTLLIRGNTGNFTSPWYKTVRIHVSLDRARQFLLKDSVCQHVPNLWVVICGRQMMPLVGESCCAIKCAGQSGVDRQIESIRRWWAF